MGLMHGKKMLWNGGERRSGIDRRQTENESPTGHERRTRPEPRQIAVVELFLSPEQWRIASWHWFPTASRRSTEQPE